MRFKLALVLFVLGALAFVASPTASAVSLPTSLYEGSVQDRSSIFRAGSPIDVGDDLEIGDEQRTLGTIDALRFQGTLVNGSPVGTKQVTGNAPLGTYQSESISGLLYDLNIRGFSTNDPPVAGENTDIYFGPGGRYASGGGTDGTWTDLHPGRKSGITATTAGGYGGLLVLYADDYALADYPNFAGAGGGHDDWLAPGDAGHPGAGVMASPDGSLSDADFFPTFSDVPGTEGLDGNNTGNASILLAAVFAPLPTEVQTAWGVPAGTTLVEQDFDPNVGGKGLAFMNVIGGSLAHLVDSDLFGPGLDMRVDFEMETFADPNTGDQVLTSDGWQIESDDPIQFGVVPEPTTISLMGLGIASLAGAHLKRRRKS